MKRESLFGFDPAARPLLRLLVLALLLVAGIPSQAATTSPIFTDADGDTYQVILTGPGTVDVQRDILTADLGPMAQLTVTGTTSGSNLKVVVTPVAGADGRVAIHSIGGTTPLGSLSAAACNLDGSGIALPGGIGRITVADISAGVAITSGASPKLPGLRLTAGQIGAGFTLNCSEQALSFNAKSAPGADIVTRRAASFKITAGDFAGSLRVAGRINSFSVEGGNLSATIAASDIGPVRVLAGPNAMGGNVNTSIIAARKIGPVTISGDLSNSKILAGTQLGADGALGGTGEEADLIGAGSIASIRIGQNVTNSFVGAGYAALDGVYGNADDTIFGGNHSKIGSIKIGATLDTASRIGATIFASVFVSGQKVDVKLDPHIVRPPSPSLATIYAIKNGTFAIGTKVHLANALVTGVGSDGFFAQVKESDPGFISSNYAALFVFTGAGASALTGLSAGDRVSLGGRSALSGTAIVLTEVKGLTIDSTGESAPTPFATTTTEISTGGALARALDGVLVRVGPPSLTVTQVSSGEFTIDDGSAGIVIDDFLYLPAASPVVGQTFTSAAGVLSLRFAEAKLAPRTAADLVAEASSLQQFGPQPAFVHIGDNGTATIPDPLTVTLTSPAAADFFVGVSSSDSNVLTVVGDGVTIPAGQTSAPVRVNGIASGTATLTATAGVVQLTADVRVVDSSDQPSLTALTPATVNLQPGAEQLFTVTLDIPAPTGGSVVTLQISPANAGTLPATVTVPANQLSATFTYMDASTTAQATLTATLSASAQQAMITTGISANGLVINEVDYDQVGTDTAEFVEIYNSSASPVSLANVALVLINGADNSEYRRVDLSSVGSIAAHGYLVIGNSSIIVPSPAVLYTPPLATWPATDAIQNGAPDGLLLLDTSIGAIIDRLSYEGSITAAVVTGVSGTVNLVEGTATSAVDGNTVTASLIRNPNGTDTNDANADWAVSGTLTPGQANMP